VNYLTPIVTCVGACLDICVWFLSFVYVVHDDAKVIMPGCGGVVPGLLCVMKVYEI
jgi:hypothetical protein